MARPDDRVCPAAERAKAHPAVVPSTRSYDRAPGRPDFVFGPFMRALDLVEHHHRPLDRALAAAAQPERNSLAPHDGLLLWTGQAVERYLSATVALGVMPDGTRLEPCKREWVYQWRHRGDSTPADLPDTKEITAWGRRYRSPDGRVRELRLPCLRSAGERERSVAEIAVAAFVLAYGTPATRPLRWGTPYVLRGEHDTVEQVRIVEYGCVDGSTKVLFEGTREHAAALYIVEGKDRLREVLTAGETRPGASCTGCKLLTVCPAPYRVPGLLGITGPRQARRTWSVTDGRYHSQCPAREHLRRLNLPREAEYGPHAVRGHAVHALLTEAHRRTPLRSCSAADGPADPASWAAGRWEITGEQAVLGADLFHAHLSTCPMPQHGQDNGVTEALTEPPVTVHDTTADVMVMVTPDLLYRHHGSWVWRETKTTKARALKHGRDPLTEFPQVALGLLLLNAGVLGGDRSGSRVELEILRPTGSDPYVFDPNDADEVSAARKVVHDLAATWHADQTNEARPGPECSTCEVSRWCPAFTATGAAAV